MNLKQNPLIGSSIIRYLEIPGTNTRARELLAKGEIDHGAVVVADHQTSGRGQRGNTWRGDKGQNLMASFVVKPHDIAADKQFNISIVAALATQHTVNKELQKGRVMAQVRIKWPNDILINNRKVAGILIENTVEGSRIGTTIIGIGINVNQIEFEGLPHACSLCTFLDNELDIERLLEDLSKNLNSFYSLLESGYEDLGIELFRDHLFGMHRWENLEINGETGEYRILGIEKDGRLKVEDRLFRTRSVMHSEVQWIRFS